MARGARSEGPGSHLLYPYLGAGEERKGLCLSHKGVPKDQPEWHPPWSLSQPPTSPEVIPPHPTPADVHSQTFWGGSCLYVQRNCC